MTRYFIKNKIVIIGGDHHNTLAAIRCLGAEKCNFSVIVHSNISEIKNIRVSYSKYINNNIKIVDNSEQAIFEALMELKTEIIEKKIILYPCSDLAALVIDKYRNLLDKYFLIPGFKNQQGKVVQLMDKWQQKLLADKYNIPMAKSWRIKLDESYVNFPNDIILPCILKPEISAYGNKSDIRICKNIDDLEKALDEFRSKEYKNVLLQQFLHKKYEVCAYGCIFNEKIGGEF